MTSNAQPSLVLSKFSGLRKLGVCLVAAGALSIFPKNSPAQDELRPSNVSARLDPQVTAPEPHYNLKLGPVDFVLGFSTNVDFNDNIGLTQVHPTSDVIITPALSLNMFWQLGAYNSLKLDTSIGYQAYVNHPNFLGAGSPWVISPDSAISYNVFVGPFTFNLHDRFQFQQDPVTEPTVSNVSELGRFINTAGLSVTWKASRNFSTQLSFDHTDLIPQNSAFDFEAYSEDQLSTLARVLIQPWLASGLEGSVASTRYKTARSDALSTHVGPFLDINVTSFTDLRVAGGSQSIFFNGSGGQSTPEAASPSQAVLDDNGDVRDLNSYYFNVEINNRLTHRIRQTLSFGRETELGITSPSATEFYLRYSTGIQLNDFASINGRFFFERGDTSGSVDNEHFRQIGFELSSAFKVTSHLSAQLSYRYTHRTSDLDLRSYDQNLVSLLLEYHF